MEGDTAEMKTKSLEEELKAVTQHSSKEKEKLEEEAEMLTCQLNKFRKEREQDLMNIDEVSSPTWCFVCYSCSVLFPSAAPRNGGVAVGKPRTAQYHHRL